MDTINQLFAASICVGNAALALTAGAATYSTTGAFAYSNKGIAYSKGTIVATASPTTDALTGAAFKGITAGQCTVLVWCVDTSGNVKVAQGGIGKTDAAGNIVEAPQFPILTDDLTAFAYSVHRGASTVSGTWTPGSSNWNATGMTSSPYSVFVLPDRPATA